MVSRVNDRRNTRRRKTITPRPGEMIKTFFSVLHVPRDPVHISLYRNPLMVPLRHVGRRRKKKKKRKMAGFPITVHNIDGLTCAINVRNGEKQ